MEEKWKKREDQRCEGQNAAETWPRNNQEKFGLETEAMTEGQEAGLYDGLKVQDRK